MSNKHDCPQCGQDMRLPADAPQWLRHLQSRLSRLEGVAAKFVIASEPLLTTLAEMQKDHHEKLVEGQTLESASKNWDKLFQQPLDFGSLVEAVKAYDSYRSDEEHRKGEGKGS